MRIGDAIKLAQRHDLDLVEVGPTAVPPVCKITSFSKMEFEAEAKAKQARSGNVKHKEMYFSTVIAQHDFDTKIRKVREFLEKSYHVTITVELPKPVLTAEQLKLRATQKKSKEKKQQEQEEFRLPMDLIQNGYAIANRISQALEGIGKIAKEPTVEHLQYKIMFDLLPVKSQESQKETEQQAAPNQKPDPSKPQKPPTQQGPQKPEQIRGQQQLQGQGQQNQQRQQNQQYPQQPGQNQQGQQKPPGQQKLQGQQK